MRKIIFYTVALILLMVLSGCKKNATILNAIAIATDDTGTFLINAQQQRLYLNEYDEIIGDFGDIIIVRKNDQYGYINKEGKQLIKPIYEQALPFSENKAVVRSQGLYRVINDKNEVLYTFNEEISSNSHYVNNRLVVEKDHRFGYMDEEFKMVTDFIYDVAYTFSEGYAAVGKLIGTRMRYSYINEQGKYQTSGEGDEVFRYTYASFFNNGYAKVSDNNDLKFGFIDDWQNIVISCTYDYAQDTIDRFFVLAKNTSLGKNYYILDNNENEKLVYKVALNRLGIFEGDMVPLDLNNGGYEIRKLIINPSYNPNGPKDEENYPWRLATVKIQSEDYPTKIPMGINNFRRGVASFYTNRLKYGLVNTVGTVLLEPIYTKIIY